MRNFKSTVISAVLVAITIASTQSLAMCQADGTHLQILGSGGPGNSAGRASSAYLLWIDGAAPLMIDAGSGIKDQFHAAGGGLNQIELLALSHLHPDHSSGLPGLLWPAGGNFTIAGPGARGVFPDIEQFMNLLMGTNGAFAVLQDRLDFSLLTLDADSIAAQNVFSRGNMRVTARGVPHGDIPTLAYKVDIGESSIVFTSDQNGSDASFIEFIRDADFLVIHLAAGENVNGRLAELHAKPSVWGQMASAAGVGHVVVSHISTSSASALNDALVILRDNYSGPVTVGEDLLCVDLSGDRPRF